MCFASELRVRARWCLGCSAWRGVSHQNIQGSATGIQEPRFTLGAAATSRMAVMVPPSAQALFLNTPSALGKARSRQKQKPSCSLTLQSHAKSARSKDGASAPAEAQSCAPSGGVGCAGAVPFGHGSCRQGGSAALVLEPAANSLSRNFQLQYLQRCDLLQRTS